MVRKLYQGLQKRKKKKTRERYQNLPEGEKEEKGQYHRKGNKKSFEEQKQKEVEYYLAHNE